MQLDFLTNRPQNVKIGDCTSSTIIMNTGMPQGCVLSPVLCLFTHDCAVIHPCNAIVKFADDTTIVGLISEKKEETANREEVQHIVQWCEDHNLVLNKKKKKKRSL